MVRTAADRIPVVVANGNANSNTDPRSHGNTHCCTIKESNTVAHVGSDSGSHSRANAHTLGISDSGAVGELSQRWASRARGLQHRCQRGWTSV